VRDNPIREAAVEYLQNHHVLALATQGPEGLWAAAVFYVNDGFDFFFLSAGHTRHGRNLAANPAVAATIQEDLGSWEAIKGVQMAGEVVQLHGKARLAAISLYMQKYLFLQKAPPPIEAALQKVNWYHLRPDSLYLIDNSKGFGHRDQILPA
jgi:uncharacterized protein YhbP (UPF0306 family)